MHEINDLILCFLELQAMRKEIPPLAATKNAARGGYLVRFTNDWLREKPAKVLTGSWLERGNASGSIVYFSG